MLDHLVSHKEIQLMSTIQAKKIKKTSPYVISYF